jgi:hypothetical protein
MKTNKSNGMLTNWYVGSLLLHSHDKANVLAQRCYFLIAADDHNSALSKSQQLGARRAKSDLQFEGVLDLLLVHEPLNDGSEILWSPLELAPSEVREHIREKQQMRALQQGHFSHSGWYVCGIVLREIHDEGSHGERTLVWINSYLIKATDPEAAYERAIEIGRKQQDEPGSHRCNGEGAHWEFEGIEDVIPVHDSPADGALLWCDDLQVAAEQLQQMVPDKSQLAYSVGMLSTTAGRFSDSKPKRRPTPIGNRGQTGRFLTRPPHQRKNPS